MPKPNNVIIMGATSLIGPYVCSRLADEGFTVECFSRNPKIKTYLSKLTFRWHEFDIKNPGDWHAPTGVIIISLLPLQILFQLLPRLKKADQIIAVSTTSVFTKKQSKDRKERNLINCMISCEREIIKFSTNFKINWTIMRPTLVYGAGQDNNISAISYFIKKFGFFIVARPASGLRQPVHADDVAQAIVAAINNKDASNTSFNLGGGETLTYLSMVKRIFESTGRRPIIICLPSGLLSFTLHCFNLVFRSSYSPALFKRMNQDLVFDFTSAKSILDYNPRPFIADSSDI